MSLSCERTVEIAANVTDRGRAARSARLPDRRCSAFHRSTNETITPAQAFARHGIPTPAELYAQFKADRKTVIHAPSAPLPRETDTPAPRTGYAAATTRQAAAVT